MTGIHQPVTYSSSGLDKLRWQQPIQGQRLPIALFSHIKELGIIKHAHRGCRAGVSKHKRTSANYPSVNNAKLGLLNSRSARSNADLVKDHLLDYDLDMLALTETWFKPGELDPLAASAIPPGYKLHHVPRKNRKGGGVALFFKSLLDISPAPKPRKTPSTFEFMEVTLLLHATNTRIIVVYRPPPSKKARAPFSVFLQEFSDLLDRVAISTGNLIVLGDFNVHWEVKNHPNTRNLHDLLERHNLQQRVTSMTHSSGHIIDFVITRSCESVVQSVSTSDMVTDHAAIHCELNLAKPKRNRTMVQYRKVKAVDRAAFIQDIVDSPLAVSPASALDALVEQYDSELESILDNHAPLISRCMVVRPVVPWYDGDIGAAKKTRRQHERKWRHTKLTVHRDIFKAQQQLVKTMIRQAKFKYYNQQIQDCDGDQRALFRVIGALMSKKTTPVLPTHVSASDLALSFSEFFIGKITSIRETLEAQQQAVPDAPPTSSREPCSVHMSTFTPASIEEVTKIVKRSASTTCSLDPIPTPLLKDCLDELAPSIAQIVNTSLATGHFPAKFKKALVTPIIKKPTLDPDERNNYRPVSNLSFVSKVVERVVAARLNAHLSANSLHECMQSAYRPNHSVETALLKVHNDIVCSLDKKQAVMLILLDLSAAFDTIDHQILLRRLHDDIGVRGVCLRWFSSYLQDRCQSVCIAGVSSPEARLPFGVPQGSVLGPALFVIYTAQIAEITREHLLLAHFYADDSQLYVAFSPQEPGDEESIARKVSACLKDIRRWMLANMLKQNDEKTEFIIACPPRIRHYVQGDHLIVGDTSIAPSASARNLGVIFDAEMNLQAHIRKVCQVSYMHLRNIASIRPALTDKAAECLIHAFITSRLDCCNSLLAGLPGTTLGKLQSIQNAAARLLTGTRKYDHITPVLRELHWLPITSRIQYKVTLLVYKTLHGPAPQYLQDLIQYRSARPGLRSAGILLNVPMTRSVTYGDRAFCSIGPTWWNSLPSELKTSPSVDSFKRNLKTHLFKLAYGQ